MASYVRIIGGAWKKTRLPALAAEGLRPTPSRVRETLFNWLGQRLNGLVCLDLFAGSGALGFEAASRGAARVLMVERHARVARQLRVNCAKLSAQVIEIIQADALQLAAKLPTGSFDVIFLDPPFRAKILQQALRLSLPLARASGAVYVEAPEPIDRLIDPANDNPRNHPAPYWLFDRWYIAHQKKAGAVHYYLLRQKEEHAH